MPDFFRHRRAGNESPSYGASANFLARLDVSAELCSSGLREFSDRLIRKPKELLLQVANVVRRIDIRCQPVPE